MANLLVDIIGRQAAKYGSREAYRFCWRKDGEWLSTSWEEFAAQVDVAGRALAALGLQEGDRLAICSPNSPQILITEFGAYRNRVGCIPIYSSSSQEQFDFIASDGGAKIAFVGDGHQYPLAYNYWKRTGALTHIVLFKNEGLALQPDDTVSITWDDFVRLGMEAPAEVGAEVGRRMEASAPEDLATLIYTSGTTGDPKGVVLTHANYTAAMEAHLESLTNVSDTELSLAFLPMSHIFEKAWCYYCIVKGVRIAVNYDPRVIQERIHEIHPNLMCCVPRFWEKVYAAVREKIASMSPLERLAVRRALSVGKRRNLDYVRRGLKVPALLEREYRFWDRRIFQRLKDAIGVPNPNMFPTAGAALSDRICEFMRSVGIDVRIGYGLSETTATVAYFPTVGYEIGSVGKPLPGVEVRISDEGEILVKGRTVTPGYYMNPEANAEAFTPDGFFRTGDGGYFDESGSLVLTERLKDLFKTANGKYIAPQALESRLAENKYVDAAAVIGDRCKFVSALIVPAMEPLRKWAETQGIDTADTARMLADHRVRDFMMRQVESVQEGRAGYEKIRRITLLPEPFSLERGEITNTLKVRRPVVASHYADEIEKMYAE